MTIQEIPFGQVCTYDEVVKRIEQPTAYRAVGKALSRNPMPIVIHCYCVVHYDGSLGGYGGKLGSERKIILLILEGTILALSKALSEYPQMKSNKFVMNMQWVLVLWKD